VPGRPLRVWVSANEMSLLSFYNYVELIASMLSTDFAKEAQFYFLFNILFLMTLSNKTNNVVIITRGNAVRTQNEKD
jgi:hypothetical protein